MYYECRYVPRIRQKSGIVQKGENDLTRTHFHHHQVFFHAERQETMLLEYHY